MITMDDNLYDLKRAEKNALADLFTEADLRYPSRIGQAARAYRSAIENRVRAEYAPLVEALTRMRNNPYWVCQCSASGRAGDLSEEAGVDVWDENAVWPDAHSHDPRCPVFISDDALAVVHQQQEGTK